jgi:predicted lactoylglutathione lyase
MDFFTQLGYSFNPQFTNEKAACMVISEDIYAMLLTEPFFKGFIPNREIADNNKTKEVLLALSADSKEKVDENNEQSHCCRRKAIQRTRRQRLHVPEKF